MSVLALDGGDHGVASDAGNDSYAQQDIYKEGAPVKALLTNTSYDSGNGERDNINFTLTGLAGKKKVKAMRMTAPSSEGTTISARENPGLEVTMGGKESHACLM